MPAITSTPFPASLSEINPFVAFAQPPEDVRAASEKMLNLWVGAVSPLWVPFFAATSFGVGTWALTQMMQRNQDILKDIPLGGPLNGSLGADVLTSMWQATERLLNEGANPTAAQAAAAVSDAIESLSRTEAAVATAATNLMNESIGLATKTIETVTQAVVEAPVAVVAKAPVFDVPAVDIPVPEIKVVPVVKPEITPELKAPIKAAAKVVKAKAAESEKAIEKVVVLETPKPASRRRPARKA